MVLKYCLFRIHSNFKTIKNVIGRMEKKTPNFLTYLFGVTPPDSVLPSSFFTFFFRRWISWRQRWGHLVLLAYPILSCWRFYRKEFWRQQHLSVLNAATFISCERGSISKFWTRQHLLVVNAATFISFERGKSYQLWTRQHLTVLERGKSYQLWTRQHLSVSNATTFPFWSRQHSSALSYFGFLSKEILK